VGRSSGGGGGGKVGGWRVRIGRVLGTWRLDETTAAWCERKEAMRARCHRITASSRFHPYRRSVYDFSLRVEVGVTPRRPIAARPPPPQKNDIPRAQSQLRKNTRNSRLRLPRRRIQAAIQSQRGRPVFQSGGRTAIGQRLEVFLGRLPVVVARCGLGRRNGGGARQRRAGREQADRLHWTLRECACVVGQASSSCARATLGRRGCQAVGRAGSAGVQSAPPQRRL